MLAKFVFGIGAITIASITIALGIGLWDFVKYPEAYKQNIDREPWLQ